MGFNAKIVLSVTLAAACTGTMIVADNAEAKTGIETAVVKSHSSNVADNKINDLSKNVTELNEKLVELTNRSPKESEVADLKKQVSALESSVIDNKKMSFDSSSSLLNVLIGLAAFIVTSIALFIGYLSFLGIKGFKELKDEINSQLSSKYETTVNEFFKQESSRMREDFNNELRGLEEEIDKLKLSVRSGNEGGRVIVHEPSESQKKPSGAFD
jgi:hypothetical protein